MTTLEDTEFDIDPASETWTEWAQELSMDLAMLATAVGLAWYSTLQIWS